MQAYARRPPITAAQKAFAPIVCAYSPLGETSRGWKKRLCTRSIMPMAEGAWARHHSTRSSPPLVDATNEQLRPG